MTRFNKHIFYIFDEVNYGLKTYKPKLHRYTCSYIANYINWTISHKNNNGNFNQFWNLHRLRKRRTFAKMYWISMSIR